VSVAEIYGRWVAGVVLSGRGEDGAAGLRMIHNRGGLALIQNPVEAIDPEMPAAAFALDDPEVLPIEELSRRVVQFCSGTTVA
jgi:two-component system chemotaxis response regulator CheB